MNRLVAICLQAGILLCLSNPLFSQNFQYPYVENFGSAQEYQLGAPNPNEGTQFLPVGIDLYEGNDPNSIYYGMVPPNSSSKPVIVFVHGYASNASVWYSGDDNMYRDVYDDGYRSAFVSLTPNRHIWTNGNMLSNSIDQIRTHYNVNTVVVVGWSKGGVDTDASIVHYGANTKVSEVFTLSTPHQGTSIAEVANSVLLSLVNIIFMQNNDATKSLTRGYISYFRSITDGNANNTVGYTTFGGWGNGPLARLDIPQTLLHAIDGKKKNGGNDGVVPYASSRRPGGRELFSGQRKEYGWFGIPYYPGPSETNLDHFEVTRGSKVWPFIKGVLQGTLRTAPNQTPSDYQLDPVIRSQSQLIASTGTDDIFQISDRDEEVKVMLMGSQLPKVLRAKSVQNGEMLPFELVQTSAEGNVYRSTSLTTGSYRLDLNQEYIALIESEGGPTATLEPLFPAGKNLFDDRQAMEFKVMAEGIGSEDLSSLKVHGTLSRINDLELQATDDTPIILPFSWNGETFQASVDSQLPAGVYSISITVEGQGFVRTIVSSVAKVNQTSSTPEDQANLHIVDIYPNPFSEVLTIELDSDTDGMLRVYDLQGRAIQQFSIAAGKASQVKWNAKASGIASGMYLLEFSNEGGQSVSERVILK